MTNGFLPVSQKDIKDMGWTEIDFLLVTGDAYVDHPSFGHAIISRVLQNAGYKVAILSQPKWQDTTDFKSLGKPRLGVMISGGIIDSMVNHYTASKKPRSEDSYSPGKKAGMRPDRCVIVYANRIREAFGDIPIIIGGVEASLRRFAHYDYWQDKVRRSILFDSRADIIGFGMGESQTIELAKALDEGRPIKEITEIAGTAYISKTVPEGSVVLPSFEETRDNKEKYAIAAKLILDEQDAVRGKILVQQHHDRFLVQNPPAPTLKRAELDKVYALPFMRTYHPKYIPLGGVPAIEEVKFSITSSRGCFGSCSFCALSMHQGRVVQSRSSASILAEAQKIIWDKDFKGYIHDVGGPTANFRAPACDKQLKLGSCKDRQCLFPTPCPNLKISHSDYLDILRKLRKLPNVKKVFVRSGIRYDYLINDKDDSFFRELCEHHVSGQLKVAPEHVSDDVLKYMGKPSKDVYKKFSDKFYKINKELGKEQYLVPYLMSSHPGSTIKDAIELAVYLKKNHLFPEQVQDFYPTPGTLSTAMFYTGLDPRTMKSVHVAKSPEEKAMQRALLQYSNPQNYELVYKALILAKREDLIGFGEGCLIRPKNERRTNNDFRRKESFGKDKNGVGKRGGAVKRKGR